MVRVDASGIRWVSSLLGRRQVDTALVCLGSLLRCSEEPLALRLHDDGTLGRDDLDRLEAGLGRFTLVQRAEADERVSELLARRPSLRAFRRENPLALKLIDVVAFAGEELSFCDSDILFVRPFRNLFHLGGPEGALFMTDIQNAYSIRSWHLLAHPRLHLPVRVNSGIIGYRCAAYDPDLLDWYLARPERRFAPVWVEQTGWALLGGRAGCRLLDPAQVAFPETGGYDDEAVVALHFVSSLRDRLAPVLERMPDRTGEAPVDIRSLPAARCGPLDLLAAEIRRRLRRHSPIPARTSSSHLR